METDSGEVVTIADSGTLVKTGYTFVEWNSKEDGSGKVFSIGEQITMGTVDIDLYGQVCPLLDIAGMTTIVFQMTLFMEFYTIGMQLQIQGNWHQVVGISHLTMNGQN